MDDEIYQKLVLIFKLFENRPHHFSRFMLDANAFNIEFLKSLRGLDVISIERNFRNIDQINEYFNSLLLEDNTNSSNKEKDLNDKLSFLIKEERYEDAARVRDYMIKNKIRIH